VGRASDLGIWFSPFLVIIRSVTTACALDVPLPDSWPLCPKAKFRMIVVRRLAADLLWCPSMSGGV
jgi:hypothetical protein